MELQQNSENKIQIEIEIFQMVAKAEIDVLRQENFNFKLLVTQLQMDKKNLQEALDSNLAQKAEKAIMLDQTRP